MFYLLTAIVTASVSVFVDSMMDMVSSGVTWGSTVAVSFTALLMAISLIAYVIHYASSR